MKAAVLYDYDTTLKKPDFVRYEDAPEPKIERPHDVIVRIGAAGVCRTDLHVVEGLWRDKVPVKLPYIMGHENAGWVHMIGASVESVKVGDAVICHPLMSNGNALAARRGNDMHAGGTFPGLDANGGYAELLRSSERSMIKLPQTLTPKDVAPHADAGITAYHAVKKAVRQLAPGDFVVVIGSGGLGHIGIQILRAMSPNRIIAIDRSELALGLARESGADETVTADGNEVESVMALTGGTGAQAVIDFVGEGGAVAAGFAMTANGGTYYVVGYGGKLEIPTMDLIGSEKSIVGNLVGSYSDLVELIALAERGMVELATREYKLSEANAALHDLAEGRIKGRGVLIP
ncbi:MAG: NAD(P)-dependent alcohol dehydrogenase [Candidatus Binataceae bacterium]